MLELAPRSCPLPWSTIPRSASGATTLTTRIPAPPTAITGRSGSTAASSSASGPGITGAGTVAAATAIAAVTATGADMDIAAGPDTADMAALRAALPMLAVDTTQCPAADTGADMAEARLVASAEAVHAGIVVAAAIREAASVEATQAAADMAVADTGKTCDLLHKGPSASARGPFALC